MSKNKHNKIYNKIVIGIDQSYTRTGISICADGKLMNVTSLGYEGLKERTDKRNKLRDVLYRLINKMKPRAHKLIILVERIRTFTKAFGNKRGNTQGLNPNYLKMTGALVATIVDVAKPLGVRVYSVDTRSWKARIVGNAKARIRKGKRDAKSETVEFIEAKGFDLLLRRKTRGKNKGEPIYDDDAADSACIALYGFLPEKEQKLELEQ